MQTLQKETVFFELAAQVTDSNAAASRRRLDVDTDWTDPSGAACVKKTRTAKGRGLVQTLSEWRQKQVSDTQLKTIYKLLYVKKIFVVQY